MDSTPESVNPQAGDKGGSGGNFGTQTKDARLIERAIKQRFPIPDDLRTRLPEILGRIMEHSDSERGQVSAARALIAADVANMEQEKRDGGGETLNVNLNGTVNHICTLTAADIAAARNLMGVAGSDLPQNG